MDRKRMFLFLERNQSAYALLIAGIICVLLGVIGSSVAGWRLFFWQKVKASWLGEQTYLEFSSGPLVERRYYQVPQQHYLFKTRDGEAFKYEESSYTHEESIDLLCNPSAPAQSPTRITPIGWLFGAGLTVLLLGGGCFCALFWVYTPRYRAEKAIATAVRTFAEADTEQANASPRAIQVGQAKKARRPPGLPAGATARETYEFVAEELGNGTTPGKIQAKLTDRGVDSRDALIIVQCVLEELPAALRARYKLPFPLILLGSAALMTLVALIATVVSFSRGLIPLYVFGPAGIYFGLIRTVVAHRKLDLAKRLERSARTVGQAETSPATKQSLVLAREAITLVEVKQGLRLWLLSAGPALAVVLLVGCAGLLWMLVNREGTNETAGRQKQVAGPNAPDADEGPPPKGWTVLFRSDDPAVWNTDSSGDKFAIPVRRAHSTIHYLRLKRMDTGDVLIVPITHQQLVSEERPAHSPGHWWYGTAKEDYGARRLGIVQVPAASNEERGLIALTQEEGSTYSGSGFGWKTYVDDRQYYCWQGKEIPRTVFEVAVTVDPLTDDEQQRYTGPEPDGGPAPRGWTVLFRSDDAAVWNSFSPAEKFAMPVGRAHATVRYLRLKRVDTGESLVVPIKRDQLAAQPRPIPGKGHGWNGTARNQYSAWHLGIFQAARVKWPEFPPGTISVMDDGWDAFRGSGFGHKPNTIDTQHYCWQGKEIPKAVFEIAVTTEPLTNEEKPLLVK
jgi:hypothetical protein